MKQQYDEGLHLETLRLLRYNAYTNYIAVPTKKGVKKSNIFKFYPLPLDPKGKVLSKNEAKELFIRKEPFISNGKFRGYRDEEDKLYNKGGILIGYVKEDIIEYIN